MPAPVYYKGMVAALALNLNLDAQRLAVPAGDIAAEPAPGVAAMPRSLTEAGGINGKLEVFQVLPAGASRF
jgi:hypothetical protein